MARNYIDFISAYCDSWCERCAFTARCSHFAVKIAEGMCSGDLNAAIELAVGRAAQPGDPPAESLRTRISEAFTAYEEPTERELEEMGRESEERRARVDAHVLATSSYDYVVAGRRWLEHKEQDVAQHPECRAALRVMQWDLFLIHVKIMRALSGHDEDPAGGFWKSRIQNDWNGSAKVALISIERSEQAWRQLAAALRDDSATALADILAALRENMSKEFPKAMKFRRPGFDTESV